MEVLNDYMYVKNGRPVTSVEKDTVAFYTYKVKAFDAAQRQYVFEMGF